MSRLRTFVVLIVLVISAGSLFARTPPTSVEPAEEDAKRSIIACPIYPRFGHPYVTATRITFTSVDGRRIVSLNRKGKKIWERACDDPLQLERLLGDLLYFQCQGGLTALDPATGGTWSLGTPPRGYLAFFDSETGSTYASPRDLLDDTILALDPGDLHILWRACGIQRVVHETDATVVVTRARREYDGDGYTLHDGELVGLSRSSGDVLWSRPLSDSNLLSGIDGSGSHVVLPGDLLSQDRKTAILDADTGATVCSLERSVREIQEEAGALLSLDSGTGVSDAHLVRIDPATCATEDEPPLVATEILRFHVAGTYVITAGWVDFACFERSTGKLLWEKRHQVEWSQPMGGSIIVTDYDQKNRMARVVSVDTPTGKGRVLYTEKVSKRDEEEFRPW